MRLALFGPKRGAFGDVGAPLVAPRQPDGAARPARGIECAMASTPGDPSLRVTLSRTFVINTVVALSLWLLVPAMGDLGSTFVYSHCVGFAITLVAVAIGRGGAPLGLWKLPLPLGLALMLLPAAPLGYLLGHALARLLLGRSIGFLDRGPVTSGAALATVLATALAGYVLWNGQRLAHEARAREQAQRLATEAELRLLRAQLEPHMLFNTLANLRELMVVDSTGAQQMLDDFIVYLRSALAATRSERTTLSEEFAQQAAYLKLMARRMGSRLSWQMDLPEDLRATQVPPMLLQPLVENAIRHGLEPQPGPGTVRLGARRDAGVLEISVTDSGPGLKPGVAAGGYGLTHVRERLRALYGEAASLRLEPVLPHGVRATVRIPGAP